MNWIIAILAVTLVASVVLNYAQGRLIRRQQRIIRDASDWIDPIIIDAEDRP